MALSTPHRQVSSLVAASAGDSVRKQRPSRSSRGKRGRTLLSGRTVLRTPKLRRCNPLPAELIPGVYPQELSHGVCSHVHVCACAVVGVRWHVCPSGTWFPRVGADQSIVFLLRIFWGPESELPKSPCYGTWAICHFSLSESF